MKETIGNALLDAVERFFATHDAWVASPFSEPPDEYAGVIEAMFSLFETSEVPPELRHIEIGVLRVQLAWGSFRASGAKVPSHEFWSVREALVAEVNRDRTRALPTIQELVRQEVPHEQICRMYGFVDADGTPKINDLLTEIDQPGSIVDESWEHPAIASEQAAIDDECKTLRAKVLLAESTV